MKLGFIMEPEASNSNYRVLMPMLALERRGHSVVWPSSVKAGAPLQALMGCDLVHCFRRPDRIADLRALSARGVAVSFDNDDDLRAIDLSSGSGRKASSGRGRMENVKKFTDMMKIARFADLTSTPSEVLAETYRAAGAANVTVIENHLDDRSIPGYGSRTPHDGMVVGWVAGREHELDLPHLSVTDAIARLLERHQDLRVLTVGSRLTLSSPRYEFRKQVQFEEIVGICSGFDIGIAPLADTQFNRARSNVKLKEYAAGGTPWLASDVGPYRGMGKREGGVLVEGDRWFEALDSLIGSNLRRWRLSRQALKWAKSQTMDKHVMIWEEAFEEAIERAQRRMAPQTAFAAR
jgi:glycosyltransferase involved in cell wall biosynthesis